MRLFDEEKLIQLIIGYDSCQEPISAEDRRKDIKDFIDSEIRRNLAEQAGESLDKLAEAEAEIKTLREAFQKVLDEPADALVYGAKDIAQQALTPKPRSERST